MKARASLFILFVFISGISQAQYKVNNAKSTMTVAGTSTMHDWESDVETISGTASLEIDGNKVTGVSALALSVPVNSIKSGKNGMDKKAYEALKEKTSPNITYEITKASVKGSGLSTTGNLSMAGKTNPASMDVTYKVNSDGSITFDGSIAIKMTLFDMKPPTAMMGAIKTGDDITITYSVNFNK